MSYDTLRCIRYPIDLRFFLRFLGRWLRLAWQGRNLCVYLVGLRVYSVLYNTFSFATHGFLFLEWSFFTELIACLLHGDVATLEKRT